MLNTANPLFKIPSPTTLTIPPQYPYPQPKLPQSSIKDFSKERNRIQLPIHESKKIEIDYYNISIDLSDFSVKNSPNTSNIDVENIEEISLDPSKNIPKIILKEDSITRKTSNKDDNDSFNSSVDGDEVEEEIEIQQIDGIKYELYEKIECIFNSISNILTEISNKSNNKNVNFNSKKFYSLRIPEISIYKYLFRIYKYTKFEESTVIYALIYIDKLCRNRININKYNIHKILFTSILISIKFNEDNIYNNKYYSKVAGINITDLNTLEYEFLSLIDFSCFVKKEVFDMYREKLIRYK